MKTITLHTDYTVCSYEELSEDDRRLIDAARRASQDSYAPYSHFRVGAAIALENGQTICGNNQENVAYPSGICAERCAMFHANALYPPYAPLPRWAIAAPQRAGRLHRDTRHTVWGLPTGIARNRTPLWASSARLAVWRTAHLLH